MFRTTVTSTMSLANWDTFPNLKAQILQPHSIQMKTPKSKWGLLVLEITETQATYPNMIADPHLPGDVFPQPHLAPQAQRSPDIRAILSFLLLIATFEESGLWGMDQTWYLPIFLSVLMLLMLFINDQAFFLKILQKLMNKLVFIYQMCMHKTRI